MRPDQPFPSIALEHKSPQVHPRSIIAVDDPTRKPAPLVRASSHSSTLRVPVPNSPSVVQAHPSNCNVNAPHAHLSKTFPQVARSGSFHSQPLDSRTVPTPQSQLHGMDSVFDGTHSHTNSVNTSVSSGQDVIALHQHILANSVGPIQSAVAIHRPATIRLRSRDSFSSVASSSPHPPQMIPFESAVPDPNGFRGHIVAIPSVDHDNQSTMPAPAVCTCCRHQPQPPPQPYANSPVRVPSRRVLPRLPQAASFPQDPFTPPLSQSHAPVSPSSQGSSISDVSPSIYGSPERRHFPKSREHSASPSPSLKFTSPTQMYAVMVEREAILLPAAESTYSPSPMPKIQGPSTLVNRFRMPTGTKVMTAAMGLAAPLTPAVSASPSPSPSPSLPPSHLPSPSPISTPSTVDEYDGMQTDDWVRLLRGYRTLIQSPVE